MFVKTKIYTYKTNIHKSLFTFPPLFCKYLSLHFKLVKRLASVPLLSCQPSNPNVDISISVPQTGHLECRNLKIYGNMQKPLFKRFGAHKGKMPTLGEIFFSSLKNIVLQNCVSTSSDSTYFLIPLFSIFL